MDLFGAIAYPRYDLQGNVLGYSWSFPALALHCVPGELPYVVRLCQHSGGYYNACMQGEYTMDEVAGWRPDDVQVQAVIQAAREWYVRSTA